MSDQFTQQHKPPTESIKHPGLQSHLKEAPQNTKLPSQTLNGGAEEYKAAGKLKGRKALITGGDSGIGRAVAILFAMEGAEKITINYLPEEETDAKETQKLVKEKGAECFLIPKILSDSEEDAKYVVEEAVKNMGGLNILINNAAYQMEVPKIKDLSAEQIKHTFNVNIIALMLLTKAALSHMTAGDTIVNNASVNHYVGHPKLVDYTATKGAIVAFTRAISNQVIGDGIRVNCVAPGPIWTPLIAATMGEESRKSFGQSVPIGRPGQPSEVATCFVFLAGPDSSYISGQTLHPNGGNVING